MRQCCPRAPGLVACKRSGLNPSRCARERRSKARPLPPPNLLTPCLRPRDLTVRICLFAAQPVNHACWACMASQYGGALGAGVSGDARGARGVVASARSDVCVCVRPQHVEADVGRVRGDRDGVRVGRGAACARYVCRSAPPRPRLDMRRRGEASGARADVSIELTAFCTLLSIANNNDFCTVYAVNDELVC